MTIPKFIKEGYFKYTVKQVKRLNDGRDLGEFSSVNKEISIDTSKPNQCVRETFLHEVIHMWCEGLHLPEIMEEVICDTLSHKMINTFRANPNLAKYFFEE